MAIWPFTRAKPGGYTGPGTDVPSHGELNAMDIQIAQAADGSLHTDAVLAKNWPYESAALTNRGDQVVWTGSRWLTVGLNVATPECSWAYEGKTWTSIGTMVGAGFSAVEDAKSNGAGLVLVAGTPSGASVKKLRRSADHGSTWTDPSSIDATAAGVKSLAWFSAASLWIAGLSDGGIETSPDGITWTNRTVPNATSRVKMAVSPTAAIALSGNTKVVRSTDGITWNEITVPTAGTGPWRAIAYVPSSGKWFIFDSATSALVAASSDDGLTWSTSGLTTVFAFRSVVAYGRMLVAQVGGGAISYSVDAGVSWRTTFSHPNLEHSPIALGNVQLLYADDTNVHYGSIHLGF